MDRRSLIFILLVTLSFLGIRNWYEKRHEEKLEAWKKTHQETPVVANETASDTPNSPIASPPALFDLPLVYTLSRDLSSHYSESIMLNSELINEVTDSKVSPKAAYGVQLGKNIFALLSDDTSLTWPETLETQSLKTQSSSGTQRVELVKAFNTSYALYATQGQKLVPAQTLAPEPEDILYVIEAFQRPLLDPESYQVIPVRIINNALVDLQGKAYTGKSALLFVQDLSTSTTSYLPVGTFSTYNTGSGSTSKISLFTEEKALQGKIVALAPQNAVETTLPTYYSLENDYQQLVFSTENGALVEINLPFHSSQDSKSIVRPISFDHTMTLESPRNARFPLHHTVLNSQGKPIQSKLGGYYPLIRRSLMSDDAEATVIAQVLPKFESALLLSSVNADGKYEADNTMYRMTSHSDHAISFVGVDSKGRTITKRYSFPKNVQSYPYCIDLEITIQGGKGLKEEVALTSGVPEIEWLSGANGASLGMLLSKNGTTSKTLERIDLPKDRYVSKLHAPDWTMNSNGFFALIIKPLQGVSKGVIFEKAPGSEAPSRLVEIDRSRSKYTEEDLPGYQSSLILSTGASHQIRLYAGPLDDTIFSTIDEASEKDFSASFEFNRALTYQGWFTFISEPFARLLYFFMKQFHALIGSWGLSIVFATIILRILLYPLNSWSMNSMRKMQEVSPLVKAIQEKYKKDPARAQKEMMALYRDKGVNPFSGCLPLLIQMPFLIGMFDLLKSTFALRGDTFIPGWINDLSAPDTLFHFPVNIPFIGNEFHLLPVLLGVTMWFQQAMSSKLPKDPKDWTDQQRQQRAMGMIMTVFMTVMFYNFPSGLNIYWISSMVLGIIQQWWTVNRNSAQKV